MDSTTQLLKKPHTVGVKSFGANHTHLCTSGEELWDMYVVGVAAEWALLEAPVAWTRSIYSPLVLRHLSLIKEPSAVHIYSGTADREGETVKEAWSFFFLAAVQCSCGFLGGKGTRRKRQRHWDKGKARVLQNTRVSWRTKHGSSQSSVDWTSCVREGPWRPWGHQGGGVWAALFSLTWCLCPRQITSGAAVTLGLDQDKQPCLK